MFLCGDSFCLRVHMCVCVRVSVCMCGRAGHVCGYLA